MTELKELRKMNLFQSGYLSKHRDDFCSLEESEQEHLLMELRNAHNQSTNFTGILIRLISKADSINRMKLCSVYPTEVAVVVLWQNGFFNEDYTMRTQETEKEDADAP